MIFFGDSCQENFPCNLALDRLVNRAANAVHHRAHKHVPTSTEANEETTNNRAMRKVDSNENLIGMHRFLRGKFSSSVMI